MHCNVEQLGRLGHEKKENTTNAVCSILIGCMIEVKERHQVKLQVESRCGTSWPFDAKSSVSKEENSVHIPSDVLS